MLHTGAGPFKGHQQPPVYPPLTTSTDAYNNYGFGTSFMDFYMQPSLENSLYLNSVYAGSSPSVDCAQLFGKTSENVCPAAVQNGLASAVLEPGKGAFDAANRPKRPLGDITNAVESTPNTSNKARIYVKEFKSPLEEQRYRERRQKNNEAAKQSRCNRNKRERELKHEVDQLRKENQALRKELEALKERLVVGSCDETKEQAIPRPTAKKELAETSSDTSLSRSYSPVIGAYASCYDQL